MKRFQVNTGLIFASWALLLIFGCHKKKPPIPPEQTPPTILSQIPIEHIDPQAGQGTEQQNPATQEQQAADTKPPVKPAPPKHPKHAPPKKIIVDDTEKPATTEMAKNTPPPAPPRVVIQEGSNHPASGQNTAGASNNDNSHSQATTQQLIDSTETNLKSIRQRTLSADEQSMVNQINDYITQSKAATKDGDLVRAHNLALKAHLLSDELVKPK